MNSLVPTGEEIVKMSEKDQMKWARFVLSNSDTFDDVLKLAKAFGDDEKRPWNVKSFK